MDIRASVRRVGFVGLVVVLATSGTNEAQAGWVTYQADAAHTGYVPGRYHFRHASLRWQTTVATIPPNGLAVGDSTIFVTNQARFSNDPSFHALDQATGSVLWSKSFGTNNDTTSPPAYADGVVYFQTDGHSAGIGNFLNAYGARTGATIFNAPYDAQWETYLNPTPFGGNIYVGGGYYGGMYSFNASNGNRNWFGSELQGDGWTPAIDGTYAYASAQGVLTMLNLCDGKTAASVSDQSFGSAVVLGTNYDAFTINNGGQLVSWDTTLDANHTPHIRWSVSGGFSGQPSLANGRLYVIANGELSVLDETTGNAILTWTPPSGTLIGPMIVTDNLVFASTATETLAIEQRRYKVIWSSPHSGILAFSNNRLYVAGSDGVVYAFGRGHVRPDASPMTTTTATMCPTTTTTTSTTTTTTTTIPACTFLLKWGAPGEFNGPAGLAVGGSGNVYVTDFYNNRVQKFDASGTFLTTWGATGSGDGQFSNPYGIATDASEQVYVTDSGNNRVQKFDASGTFLTMWGTYGSGNGQFNTPAGAATDGSGNVYVTDFRNHRVEKFDSTGAFLSMLGGPGFYYPGGVATDASGNVYVADTDNNRVQKFDATGAFLTAWGGFSSPYGVATDNSGHVYVSDYYNGRIDKFDTSGVFLGAWGSYGSADGQFINPRGVATDGSGNVYVADHGNNRVQKFACP